MSNTPHHVHTNDVSNYQCDKSNYDMNFHHAPAYPPGWTNIESNCDLKVIMWLSFLNCHHYSRYKYIPMFEYFSHIVKIYLPGSGKSVLGSGNRYPPSPPQMTPLDKGQGSSIDGGAVMQGTASTGGWWRLDGDEVVWKSSGRLDGGGYPCMSNTPPHVHTNDVSN